MSVCAGRLFYASSSGTDYAANQGWTKNNQRAHAYAASIKCCTASRDLGTSEDNCSPPSLRYDELTARHVERRWNFGFAFFSQDIKDMDLNDPDLAKAAVKIQATFRGYKTRSKVE